MHESFWGHAGVLVTPVPAERSVQTADVRMAQAYSLPVGFWLGRWNSKHAALELYHLLRQRVPEGETARIVDGLISSMTRTCSSTPRPRQGELLVGRPAGRPSGSSPRKALLCEVARRKGANCPVLIPVLGETQENGSNRLMAAPVVASMRNHRVRFVPSLSNNSTTRTTSGVVQTRNGA